MLPFGFFLVNFSDFFCGEIYFRNFCFIMSENLAKMGLEKLGIG